MNEIALFRTTHTHTHSLTPTLFFGCHHSLLLIHRSNFHSNGSFFLSFSFRFCLHTFASYVLVRQQTNKNNNNNNTEMHFKYFMNKRRNLIIFYCKNCNQNLNHTHTYTYTLNTHKCSARKGKEI